jgi:hypothetical protein
MARSDDVVERERGELVGGQYSVFGYGAHQIAVALGQPDRCLKHRLVGRTVTRAPRDGRL